MKEIISKVRNSVIPSKSLEKSTAGKPSQWLLLTGNVLKTNNIVKKNLKNLVIIY